MCFLEKTTKRFPIFRNACIPNFYIFRVFANVCTMKWYNKLSALIINLSPFFVATLELRRYFVWIHFGSSFGFHMDFPFPPVAYQKQNFVTNFIHGCWHKLTYSCLKDSPQKVGNVNLVSWIEFELTEFSSYSKSKRIFFNIALHSNRTIL